MKASADRPTLGFVGAGRLGAALALAAATAGFPVVAVASRTGRSAGVLARRLPAATACSPAEAVRRCEVVFLPVPDGAIASVGAELPWRAGQIAIHASAVDGPEILETAGAAGAHPGTFHPLQAFGEPERASASLHGATVALDGDAVALGFLRSFAEALGCRPIHVPAAARVLYHAAAVMSSNHLATLLDTAQRLWEAAGLPSDAALPALAPLTRSALDAVETLGPSRGLTGPIARGDAATITRHLAAIRQHVPELLPLYRQLALATIDLAQRGERIDTSQATALRRAVEPPGRDASEHAGEATS